MGGDDLGSDDEFLTAPIRADTNDASSENDDSSTIDHDMLKKRATSTLKDDTSTPERSSKKRKKSGENSLMDLGANIRTTSKEMQAKLLSEFSAVRFLPQHISQPKNLDDNAGIVDRIKSIVSKKTLKKWKTKKSPGVIIICLSARRAVQVLKEISPLNVRAAKLFAKHITIEDQVKQLQDAPFGIAVGTPHRILTLLQQDALSLEQTQSIVLDTFVNDKKYSVYTLPDTVPHTQELLKDHVYPTSQKRQTLHLAFV